MTSPPPPQPRRGDVALPRALLLDLDGTLVHSLPEITHALNQGLRDSRRSLATESDVRSWIGNGAVRLCSRALGTEDESAPGVESLYLRFMAHYAAEPGVRTVPYPGVPEMLGALRAANVRLGCVTNKPEGATTPLLEHLDMTRLFDVVVCPETVGIHKPDPAPVVHALRCLDVAAEDALHVGDSTADILAARGAGVAVVALTDGYADAATLFAAQPDWQLPRLTDLHAVLGL